MAHEVSIRPITEGDIEGFRAAVDLVARERRYLSRMAGPSPDGAAHFVRSNIAHGHPQFVAICDDTLIGWCDIVRSDGDYESHVGSMGMGLLPAWRGQGHGSQLLLATLARARQIGLSRIELEVHGSNARAISLYRRLVFIEEGRKRRARYIDERFEDIILMARLDEPHTP